MHAAISYHHVVTKTIVTKIIETMQLMHTACNRSPHLCHTNSTVCNSGDCTKGTLHRQQYIHGSTVCQGASMKFWMHRMSA